MQQEFEDVSFLGCEPLSATVPLDLVGFRVEAQLADPEDRGAGVAGLLAFEDGTQAKQELLVVEWLDHVVISTAFEAVHPVLHPVTGSEQDDGKSRGKCPKVLGQFETIPSGQHHVQQGKVE